ncbi:VHS-domain-containing protein [Dichomitus squalens]|uniref:VHS-domain-containing protein n=1 Tax=Dichomitus squalens (strain LYAD-421) TaxID=732165 RepID=UPI0004415594|nr:VHS-domain-containing protein [Dichomitus squalens LYAD-421 SS1]EJF63733.1 VHS-domain-containing protein [Dichomitus squalens LYAD-421 SS1]TBU48931.1 VHS-domain-containing protein [Dichomitus squalens]
MFPASTSAWTSNVSQLEVLITRACNPTMGEPNYALHLEVAEYINQKKANTPREAAMTIARLVNHRNPHIAMLALALLETLVQSCGYPFHLQISTKEFLNELVRRFPERPPPFPGPVMQKILDLIHSWKEGICVESRWKDDFANIRDMHRLLTFKGYRFRDAGRQQASSAPSSSVQNLKSAEELEAEDREAQQAKLQELIRRGTPRDLAAAQELMKTLAGANPDAKPDYRTQSLTELNKLESKVILLNEILDNVDTTRGEKFVQGDVYDQVASILRDARPKIQKWISNAEEDDPESLDTYLQINDQINTVLNRYESYKKGDFSAAANPIPAELSNGAQGVSLIDLDDAPAPSSNAGGAAGGGGINDLADLFGASPAAPQAQPQTALPPGYPGLAGSGFNRSQGYGVPMSAGLGVGTGFGVGLGGTVFSSQPVTPAFQAPSPMGANGPPGNLPQRAGTTSPSSGAPLGSIRLGTPQLQPQSPAQQPQYSQSSAPGFFGQPVQPPPFQQQQFQQQQLQQQQFQQQPFQQPLQPQVQQSAQPTPANGQAQGKDPFADLVGLF